MTLPMNRKWIYSRRPEGEVGESNYTLKEEPVEREPREGEILVRARYISVDPYMRIGQSAQRTWGEPHPVGEVQGAGVVGQVEASRDASGRIKAGDWVNVYTGWQLYGLYPAADAALLDPSVAPVSTALGVLGMPGLTAYFGLLEAGRPRPGETVVVSGAAGAVGAIVAQIAKVKGCRVVGIVGSDAKAAHLKNDLGVDATVNYRTSAESGSITGALSAACPEGIDVYFDNVGGPITDSIWPLINLRARVIICGQISQYSGGLDNPDIGPRFLHRILYTRATIQGILARDYRDRNAEMLAAMGPWVRSGRIKYVETILEGFENLPAALNGLFHGKNTGKMVVRV